VMTGGNIFTDEMIIDFMVFDSSMEHLIIVLYGYYLILFHVLRQCIQINYFLMVSLTCFDLIHYLMNLLEFYTSLQGWQRVWMNAKLVSKSGKRIFGQRFGAYICNLLSCRQVLKLEMSGDNFFMDEMIIDFNVFGSSMEQWIIFLYGYYLILFYVLR